MPIPRKILLAPLVALSAVCGYFAYMAWAFPDMRCEGIHLVAPDAMRATVMDVIAKPRRA